MKHFWKKVSAFIAVGLILYAVVHDSSEVLLYRHGKANPFFKILTAPLQDYDVLILGASHAMPLDFADMGAYLEAKSDRRIINLATPGGGILYNRFVLDYFLKHKKTRSVLYVLDSFAFYSPTWNEERFEDAKMMRGSPFDLSLGWQFITHSQRWGLSPTVALDYWSGFSKINNRDRFKADIWEGEAKFDRKYRFSKRRDPQRIRYLYPFDKVNQALLERYLGELGGLAEELYHHKITLIVIKMPIPAHIYAMIPNEVVFNKEVEIRLQKLGAAFHDFSLISNNKSFFFDTDHLNRIGIKTFIDQHLVKVLSKAEQ